MKERKHLVSVAAVLGGALATALGLYARDTADLGSKSLHSRVSMGGLFASKGSSTDGVDIPETAYFNQITQLLKDEYVEPISDDTKLATGAIRGMITSLENAHSLFFKPELFKIHTQQANGIYEGIGVTFAFDMGKRPLDDRMALVPQLVVASVAPGSSAAQKGVRVGDAVDTVDGHWIINTSELQEFRLLQVAAVKDPVKAEELKRVRTELRMKTEKAILPYRAYERLIQGTTGSTTVKWRRGNDDVVTELTKGKVTVPSIVPTSNGFKVLFRNGIAEALDALPESPVTLDLRSNSNTDLALFKAAIGATLPTGTVGNLVSARPEAKPIAVGVSRGTAKKRTYSLIVDTSTRGAAAAFAAALQSKGVATVSGTLPKEKILTETVALPDGSGYTLARGAFRAGGAK